MLSARASPLPVLVVDDDSALIRTLADILRDHGYEPATAETGARGLELARAQPPAIAVVDLRLPDMDGVELASRLHQLSELTEVIVLTGNASVESAVAALREQSVDYLIKPVRVERLLQVASAAAERWQRRNAEERLRASDERFRRVVESGLLGVAFWDAEGTFSDGNDAFLRIVGGSRDAMDAGRLRWPELTPPEQAALEARKLAELRAHGVVAPYEQEFVRADGTRVPVLVGAATLEGRTDFGVCFVLDITEHKRVERALEARAEQQAAVAALGRRALLLDSVTELYDDAARLVAATLGVRQAAVFELRSDGASLLLAAGVGWHPEEIGQKIASTAQVPQVHDALARSEAVVVEDATRPTIDRDTVWMREHGLASGVVVAIPGAAYPHGVLAAHADAPRHYSRDDVHFLEAIAHILGTAVERSRTERAFRQAQRLEAVGRLASGVAHDFNNMLTAITGYGEMIRTGLRPEDPIKDDVEEILKAARRAAGLTRQLLAFSRQQVLKPRLLDLNEIVRDMEGMVRRLIGDDVKLVTVLAPDLGWVKADPGQIEQVLLNLCVNARDAMPGGGTLTVETQNAELDPMRSREYTIDAPGSYVMLAVSDTGTGMTPETRARLFEPFFTTKEADKGTGLGLATVYGIVKQSGGDVWVYSEPGQGSAFKIFLPRTDENVGDPADGARTAGGRGAETILLAEDEDAIRRVAQRVLEKAGYRVLVARNGAEASELAARHAGSIDLLVTDMVMPQMNGADLAQRLRGGRSDLRVLFLSGHTEATVLRRGFVDPGAHFLQKPFTADLLTRRVREALDTPVR